MSNYAALVDVLSIAGSRKSDGTANASGTIYFFQPGTNTQVNAYSDAAATTIITQPVTLSSGGLLNRTDFPSGIYVTQPVRIFIQDTSGNTVADTVYVPATAGDVGVKNAGFTDSTLDAVLTKAQTSFGGTDWKYLIAVGQTERPIGATITEICVSVKSFGAKGDNVAIDTTAVQNAINYVKALGGGVVWFPAGTYKIDQALTLSSASGVTFRGAGMFSTTIMLTNGSANAFTITSCQQCRFEYLNIDHSSSSSGNAISLTGSASAYLVQVGVSATTALAAYAIGVSATNSVEPIIRDPRIFANECVFLSGCTDAKLFGGLLSAAVTYAIEFTGSTYANLFGVTFTGAARFAAALTGENFGFVNCGLTSLSIATATIPVIRLLGTGLTGSSTSSAVGAAQTPSLISGSEVLLSATSGGAGTVTVNAPAILPSTSGNGINLYWDFVFKNSSGGAVTWSLNAVYVVASAIPTTDGHTVAVRFRWDRTTSKLREVSRADTVT